MTISTQGDHLISTKVVWLVSASEARVLEGLSIMSMDYSLYAIIIIIIHTEKV